MLGGCSRTKLLNNLDNEDNADCVVDFFTEIIRVRDKQVTSSEGGR